MWVLEWKTVTRQNKSSEISVNRLNAVVEGSGKHSAIVNCGGMSLCARDAGGNTINIPGTKAKGSGLQCGF